jgi:hypothetical protein
MIGWLTYGINLRKPALIRTTYRNIRHGEAFFYQKLLEIGHWRSETDIRGGFDTYKSHFLHRWPELYADLLDSNRSTLLETIHLSTLYQEECDRLLNDSPIEVQQLIADELRLMNQIRPQSIPMSAVLDLEGDQYNAYNRITTAIAHRYNHRSHRFFITGPAGTGKSFLLKVLEGWFQSARIKFLKMAPTGIAACAINGKTIHSALSITQSGRHSHLKTATFNSEQTMHELRKVQVLIIDEISMVNADLLTFISTIFARLHDNMRPFGGLHVLCFGDLLQLPPVSGLKVFRSPLWPLFFPLFLRRSYRHDTDHTFGTMLDELRFGRLSMETLQQLRLRKDAFDYDRVNYHSTMLVPLRRTARALNQLFLQRFCPADNMIHEAQDREGDRILDGASTHSSFRRETNLPETVICTPGARVMYLNNTLMEHGISNGTCGVIIALEQNGMPKVSFPTSTGLQVCVPHSFQVRMA